MVEGHAVSRYQHGSAKKLALIAELVRGQDVPLALRRLAFLPKPTKAAVMKTLRSAVANAIARAGKAKLHEGDLVVSEVTVGPGPTLKRWQPGPRGSATPIRKRSVHVRVRVTSRDAAEK